MKEHQKVAQKAIDYIESNIDRDLKLDDIARDVGYSKFHLNRIFAQHTGNTLYGYIRKRKLTIAAQKLVGTKKSIVEVALEAGYDSQQSFTLAFKQLYDDTPQAYRNSGHFQPRQEKITMRLAA